MSLDAQMSEMLRIAQSENLEIVEIKQESKSAKEVSLRPEYNQLLKEVDEGKFRSLKISRLPLALYNRGLVQIRA